MDAVDSQGRGPLHHAVESGSYEAVMWVMEECRDVSPQDAAGVTPLHIAIEHDYMDIGASPPSGLRVTFGMLEMLMSTRPRAYIAACACVQPSC
jgi:hypothetical protein